jgi:endoglucanase
MNKLIGSFLFVLAAFGLFSIAQPAVAHAATNTGKVVNVWWPLPNTTISGSAYKFKAVLYGAVLSDYDMYWQVDNGQMNKMDNSTAGSPHKESTIDLRGWTWKGSGPYTLTFTAKKGDTVIASKNVSVNIGTTPTASATVMVTAPKITTSSGNPISGLKLYVDPNSNAKRQADLWRSSLPTNAALMDKIANQSQARWFGNWNGNIESDVRSYVDAAAHLDMIPTLIAYNIPQRDCGSYSAGGSSDADAYRTWIKGVANGIGSRKAIVVLEPDALSLIDCLSAESKTSRFTLIKEAISTLKANGKTLVYVDAGNSNWIGASEMASRLKSINIASADGFAVNVSNYYNTGDLITYGTNISKEIGNKHFVIDTSRNGNGPDGSNWCNPSGRALGLRPTTSTGNSLVDAFLWLKSPGESDGSCNGGPSAGVWWPEYALGLAQRAAY